MMWLNQRPTDGGDWPQAWFNIEIVSPWRSAGVPRFIAAAEVACAEFFNPVIPEVLAEQLRAFVDQHPEFETPVERLATYLARLDDDEE